MGQGEGSVRAQPAVPRRAVCEGRGKLATSLQVVVLVIMAFKGIYLRTPAATGDQDPAATTAPKWPRSSGPAHSTERA